VTELGQKIKALRQHLGLSQQQLAGSEMTRAFISQVESGKCRPSRQSLQLIAQRLGKTLDYFLHDEDEDTLTVTLALIETADREMKTAGTESRAKRKLQRALSLLAGFEAPELEGRARLLLARCLRAEGATGPVRKESERAVACFRSANDRNNTALALTELGATAYRQEDFETAKHCYQEALVYCSGLKTMQPLYIECLIMLGSTLYCLGEYTAAAEHYQRAWSEGTTLNQPLRMGKIAMGLGWTLFLSRDLQAARRWTNQAVQLLGEAKSGEQLAAEHNLALIEADLGNWERSYIILQACLRRYEEQGRPERQANVLEDLARYWQHKGDMPRAEKACWQAIDLLDLADNRMLRGRLYRRLGLIAAGRGNLREAYCLQKISLDLLQLVGAMGEVELTQAELERVRRLQAISADSALA
jgi:tetratricopeptide (TPR) repeat protein